MSAEPMAVAVAAKALDGLTMRMAAISQNLANANSARFRPVDVNFEHALQLASGKDAGAVRALNFHFTAGREYSPGEDRRIDLMIADAAQTAMRYSALVDMLGRRFAIQHALAGAR